MRSFPYKENIHKAKRKKNQYMTRVKENKSSLKLKLSGKMIGTSTTDKLIRGYRQPPVFETENKKRQRNSPITVTSTSNPCYRETKFCHVGSKFLDYKLIQLTDYHPCMMR